MMSQVLALIVTSAVYGPATRTAMTPISKKPMSEWLAELDSASPKLRSKALDAVALLDPTGRQSLPDLAKASRHPDPATAAAATQVIGDTRSSAALRILQDAIRDRRPTVRQAAVSAFGKLGNAGIPALAQALE